MQDTLWHVVGSRFSEFARNRNVIRITELIAALEEGGLAFGDEVRFIAGQGLQEALVDELLQAAEKAGRMALFSRWKGAARADGPLSHKHRRENTLISAPVKVAENLFEAELWVDERIDLITDHITGQHLPGMILVEASRQMFIATFERHFNPLQDEVAFLVTELNNAFHQLAFPVATEVSMTIVEHEASKLQFRVHVEIFQAGGRISEHFGRITVCRRQLAVLLENRHAKRVLRALQAVAPDELSAPARSESDEPQRIAS